MARPALARTVLAGVVLAVAIAGLIVTLGTLLRRATPEECAANKVDAALATADGTRIFVIDNGIPILLPR